RMTVGMSLGLARRRPPTRRAIPTGGSAGRVSAPAGWYQTVGMGAFLRYSRQDASFSCHWQCHWPRAYGPAVIAKRQVPKREVRVAIPSFNETISTLARSACLKADKT